MKSDSSDSSEDDSSFASGNSVAAPNLDAAVARALVLSGRRMPLAVELLEAIHGTRLVAHELAAKRDNISRNFLRTSKSLKLSRPRFGATGSVFGVGRPRLDLEYPVYGAHELADEGAFTSVAVLTASFLSGVSPRPGFVRFVSAGPRWLGGKG